LEHSPNIVAIIQARMRSTRLPGKILAKIAGHPLLWHVVERVRQAKNLDQVLVATTGSATDDVVAAFCAQNEIPCFRGSEDDVLDRYYQAARWIGADVVVRITADCPLIDPVIINQVVAAFLESTCDYANNTLDRTYPDGLDTEVFSFDALAKAWREAKLLSEREHVTPYIWQNKALFNICGVTQALDLSSLRWTVDEPEDLAFVRHVYDYLYRPGQLFLMGSVLGLLDKHPELTEINQRFERNEGYTRSLEQDGVVEYLPVDKTEGGENDDLP
jgi:spore coat polysaccharide biosynthesis protein SpsF